MDGMLRPLRYATKGAVRSLVLGVLGVVLASCASSDSASSSSSSSSEPDPDGNGGAFALVASASEATVFDGSVLFAPQVSFDVQNARGEVGFAVRSEPAVDWFEVSAGGVLAFAGLQRADYDADALADAEDGGQGRAIELVVTATDAGRSEANVATATVRVLVALRPFLASVSPSTVYTRHGLSVFLDFVLFQPSNPRGVVSYEVVETSPAVDWFDLDADGLLHFTEGQSANYDAEELKDAKDAGEGKPVVLTVALTDGGRPGSRHAMVDLVVNVLPPPFELNASPSVVTIDSGSNRLNASNRIDITLGNPQYLLGEASYSVSTELEGEWFAIRSSEDDARNGVLSLARVLDYAALDSVPQTEAGRLLQVQVRLEDRGRTMDASAEQLVDVVVTLRSQIAPLALDPSTLLAEVTHGESAMLPEVRFTPNALGTMTYDPVLTQPAVDWFVLKEEGENGAVLLEFAEDKVAIYDDLSGLPDKGVRSVTVTVTGSDAGRAEGNRSSSSIITLDVHQQAVELTLSSSTVDVLSGETTLRPAVSLSSKNTFGRVRYAIREVRPAVDWFAIDAATGSFFLDLPANYFDPALAALADNVGKPVEVDLELIALDRAGAPSAVATLVVKARQAVEFSVLTDNARARVEHLSTELSTPIQFSTQGPTSGEAEYTFATEPPSVEWIAVGKDDGVLSLSAAADYINLAGTSLNGIKEVVVTVTATDEASSAASAGVIIEVVRPAEAFHLLTDVSEASVRHGDTTLSPAINLSVENGTGTITVAQASPAGVSSWFAVTNGTLTLSAAADYGADSGDALESITDFGQGKSVLVTLNATDDDSDAIAQTTVQVFVLPPLLEASILPAMASIQHAARAIDTALTVSVTQGVGVLNYEVLTDPATDWFGVKPSSGVIYVRADRAIDWSALDVEAAEDGSKPLAVRVRVTDGGRTGEDAAESLPVTLNITPVDLTIYASRASAPVEDGTSDQSTTIRFSSEGNTGEVNYSIAGTSPEVDWFVVDGDGDLLIAMEKTASYSALEDIEHQAEGRSVYVSVKGMDSGKEAFASVIIHVRPPQFDLQVSATEVDLQEQGISLETEVAFSLTGAVGSVNYQLATSPAVDWFEVVDNKLALVYATDVRSETIGTNTIRVYVTARDSGRSSLDPDALSAADVIIIKLVPASGSWIELNTTRAEFFEKGGKLNPPISFQVQGALGFTSVNVRIRGDNRLCNPEECKLGFYLNEDDTIPSLAVAEEGGLFVRLEDANFWHTKFHYDDRGDDQTLPLYAQLVLHYTGDDGAYRLRASRDLLLTMKNILNDERITKLEGDELIMSEGDANDLFFFPISTKIPLEATAPRTLTLEVTDDRFTLRDVNFAYRAHGGQIDAGEYGVHEEPYVSYLGASSFKPCRGISQGGCYPLSHARDFRLALKPGESLQYGEEPVTVTVTASIFDAVPGSETATADFTVRVIERQDGTEEHPFIVDTADELRSLATRLQE